MQETAIITKITPEKAKQILQDNGLLVSNTQALELVKFLTTLATTTLNNEAMLSVHKGKH